MDDAPLRAEVRYLGAILGDVIRRKEGEEIFLLEERVRKLSKERRAGLQDAERELQKVLSECPVEALFALCRAFSIFFDLANLAEDRHRIRVLRERERRLEPSPRPESIRDALRSLKEAGVDPEGLRTILSGSTIEPVFTAHPTEAKRRAVRSKLRRIRGWLEQRQEGRLLQREEERIRRLVTSELLTLWETDLLRAKPPTVMEEVERSLFVLDSLWEVVPLLREDFEQALAEFYPELRPEFGSLWSFGTWIGGDRDGNPYVTASVTAATLETLRRYSLTQHRRRAQELLDTLTQSSLLVRLDAALLERLDHFLVEFPALRQRLEDIPEEEVYRRYLAVLDWRLEQTQEGGAAGYRGSAGLLRDLQRLQLSLRTHRPLADSAVIPPLEAWIACTQAFGFCTARLDLRENARRYRAVVAELMAALGLHRDFASATEEQKLALLTQVLEVSPPLPTQTLSADGQAVQELFGVLEQFHGRTQGEGLGAHVVSMTEAASDLLGLLWLRRSFGPGLHGPLVPLLETVADLQRGPAILETLLTHPIYRAALSGRQMIMIGYSDSTKDGGYLSANWNLYQAQRQLAQIGKAHGVELLFFHGRGGSLGRGGGPAARSILSLPVEVARGGLRVTEQGEVLAERYDDPAIAYRHLEQLMWAQLSIHAPTHARNEELAEKWAPRMTQMSEIALKAYRELLELPGFLTFFREITPISEIERLQIGSRPARRQEEPSLENLRAIPWSFAWTQARILLPAWYGLGVALESLAEPIRREMYREWSFFQAIVSNATLALTKADMGIAQAYAQRRHHDAPVWEVWRRIQAEHHRTVALVLETTGESELLDSVPWLAASLTRRNPYVDPLNFIQLRAFEQSQQGCPLAPVLMRLAIKGVAAGLRTTG